ncbi:MAG: cell wall hydrolase [Melioribacteraceae bacterium]
MQNKSLILFGLGFYILFAFAFMQSEKKADSLQEQVNTLTNELDEKFNLDFYWISPENTKKLSDEEEHILALNIYFESGVEDYSGKIAVAQVTLNRVNSNKYGDTVKEVVYSPSQFSWTLKERENPEGVLWEESKRAARDFNKGLRIKELDTCTSYHADYVSPKWAKSCDPVVKIGKHIFYKG